MAIDFGSDEQVVQAVPPIQDSFGLLAMGLCPLAYTVVLEQNAEAAARLLEEDPTAPVPPAGGAPVGFLDASEELILLQTPQMGE